MKGTATLLLAAIVFVGIAMMPAEANAQAAGYVGEAQCLLCHTTMTPKIVNNYMLNGHRYKLNPVENGAVRAYPAGRINRDGDSPAAVTPPAGTTWAEFAYVIGGYGWKARFIRLNGRIYTDDAEAQQNLYATAANGAPLRVTYHEGDDNKKYNFACFVCHTTGGTAEGSWNGVPADELGTFKDPGVTCEGCHGPGADHAAGAFAIPPVLPPNTGNFLKIERCIECHQRGGATNAIPVSKSYIKHHEQGNEMRASAHGDGVGQDLTCVTCHNQHVPDRYSVLATDGENSLNLTCVNCHGTTKSMPLVNGVAKSIECVDCHMPKASKSALGFSLGDYGFKGDVPTHLMKINTNPVTREAMFTADGKFVELDADGHGAVTMDFACLGCHTDKNVGWAAAYAEVLHSASGVVTANEDLADVPVEYELGQNYPNPFNPTTTIAFKLPETADVKISIYSVDGQLVQTILSQRMPSGSHQVTMNADFLSSGTYLYRLTAGSYTESRMMTLLK